MQATHPVQSVTPVHVTGDDLAAQNRELQAKIQALMTEQLQKQKEKDQLENKHINQNLINNHLQSNVQQLRKGLWGRIATIAAAVAVVALAIFCW